MSPSAVSLMFLWLFSLPLAEIEEFSPICEDLVIHGFVPQLNADDFSKQNHQLVLADIYNMYHNAQYIEVYCQFVDHVSFLKWIEKENEYTIPELPNLFPSITVQEELDPDRDSDLDNEIEEPEYIMECYS